MGLVYRFCIMFLKNGGMNVREIKFRVFDKDLKKMHICGENIHDSMSFINGQACYYNLQNGCGSLPAGFDGERTYELMQYTGLKDKNGKEIYERDIVLYKDSADRENHLVVKWNSLDACFDFGWVRTNYAMQGEVIGNIYENPELVEKVK